MGKKPKIKQCIDARNRFCHAINVIGREIIGPRIDSFKNDCCSEEAVVRETLKLIEKIESENTKFQTAIEAANEVITYMGDQLNKIVIDDLYAQAALTAYAEAYKEEYPELAKDLFSSYLAEAGSDVESDEGSHAAASYAARKKPKSVLRTREYVCCACNEQIGIKAHTDLDDKKLAESMGWKYDSEGDLRCPACTLNEECKSVQVFEWMLSKWPGITSNEIVTIIDDLGIYAEGLSDHE